MSRPTAEQLEAEQRAELQERTLSFMGDMSEALGELVKVLRAKNELLAGLSEKLDRLIELAERPATTVQLPPPQLSPPPMSPP